MVVLVMDLSISNTSTAKIKTEPCSEGEEESEPIGEDVETQSSNVAKERLAFGNAYGLQNQDSINSNVQIIKSEPLECDEGSATTTHFEVEVGITGFPTESLEYSNTTGKQYCMKLLNSARFSKSIVSDLRK